MLDWIDVQTTPLKDQYRLVVVWNNGWRIAYRDSSGRWLEQGNHQQLMQVSHYAELPPGPNGEH